MKGTKKTTTKTKAVADVEKEEKPITTLVSTSNKKSTSKSDTDSSNDSVDEVIIEKKPQKTLSQLDEAVLESKKKEVSILKNSTHKDLYDQPSTTYSKKIGPHPWSDEEEDQLILDIQKHPVETVAKMHDRSIGAVKTRLLKMASSCVERNTLTLDAACKTFKVQKEELANWTFVQDSRKYKKVYTGDGVDHNRSANYNRSADYNRGPPQVDYRNRQLHKQDYVQSGTNSHQYFPRHISSPMQHADPTTTQLQLLEEIRDLLQVIALKK